MGQKLHRGRRSVFRKRRPFLKTFAWILVAVLIVGGGYLAAMLATPGKDSTIKVDSQPSATHPATKPTQPAQPADPAPPSTEDSVTPPAGIKGFFLPHKALTAEGLGDTLAAAKQAGFTAVLFDLKDVEGRLYYHFSAPQAAKVNSFTKDALTEEQLKSLFSAIKEAGLTPVPRLHAFRDNLGAKALTEARIAFKENPSWAWFDGSDSSTAKRWLSPYDNDAHQYIGALAEELKDLGAGAVMLDSVQFPNPKSTYRASFGSDNAELKPGEVLTKFVGDLKSRLGETCPVILACTGESVLNKNATQIYGDNPLDFAPTLAAPALSATKLTTSVATILERIQLVEGDPKPLLSPWLEIDGLSAANVKQAIADCIAGGAENYILYSPKGNYDFDAYQ